MGYDHGHGSASMQYSQTIPETAYFNFYSLWIFPAPDFALFTGVSGHICPKSP